MKYLYIIILGLFLYACHEQPVGFLLTENAEISVDSLIIDKELETHPPTLKEIDNPQYLGMLANGYTHEQIIAVGVTPTIWAEVAGKHYYRFTHSIPWVSHKIEGIEGTLPLTYTVVNIREKNGGDVSKLLEVIKARGDGAIEVPLENEVPIGEYLIDVKVSNEGYSDILTEILRIIVQ